MKLKYYLRGVGIGIIFATLVMTVSSFMHKNNITNEYIIQEARKLGMIMKEEQKDNESLWGNDDTENDSAVDTENSTPTVSSESESQTPPASQTPSETPTPSESESQTPSETPTPSESESQTPPASQTPSETPTPSESESESEADSQAPAYVTVTISAGDYARQVAEKMYAAGLISDAEEFRKYIGSRGYGQSIRVGTYSIPVGATYEEICKIITTKP